MDLLEQLQKKPIPKKKVAQAIFTTTQIIDETTDDFKREEFMKFFTEQPRLPDIPDEEEEIETKIAAPRKEPKEPKEPKPKKAPTKDEFGEVDETLKYKKKTLQDRMPDQAPAHTIKVSPYYLNNREKFIGDITAFFRKYSKDLDKEAANISCERRSQKFSLLTHQKIIRDYLNTHSPYRGLLVYHGLGSGKTCSSIAIAEGFKTDRQIIIMTPASLQMNYRSELKKCGDELYKYNQHWEFIPIKDKALTDTLSGLLSIPLHKMKNLKLGKTKGVMFVDSNKEPNYKKLPQDQKELLDKQLKMMIETKYMFINYNGLRAEHLQRIAGDNPFDNKVIVIDEVHNFVSRIANKIKQKESLSMKLYKYLLSANNTRIIALTGTPVINYPNELGILFNILRGYIKTYTIKLKVESRPKKSGKERDRIQNIVKNIKTFDIIKYTPQSNNLTVTRNPFGFQSAYDDSDEYQGVSLDEGGNISDEEMLKALETTLKENGISIRTVGKGKKDIKITNHTALPDQLKPFKKLFIKKDSNEIQNGALFKRRIIGLTSFFRSAQEQLLPAYSKKDNFHLFKIPMSKYQLSVYEEARKKERNAEKNNAKKAKMAAQKGNDIYDSGVSTYRLFSRAFCNFVFPREIERPMPEHGYDEDLAYTEEEKKVEDPYLLQKERALESLRSSSDEFLNETALKTYSPKFLKILNEIDGGDGLHLIYSQFRTLEGIGILQLVLEANGFVQFKIAKNKKKEWYVVPTEEGKQTYTLYTGTESVEEKEIIRNIFNNSWDLVPDTIVNQLKKKMGDKLDNKHGEIIKVFMITSAGAEGISLHNVRYVHIVEPYWHAVRMEQVIGRARRICSHQNLPKKERKVDVNLYLMTFTDEQIKTDLSIELKLKDKSKIVKKDGQPRPVTSDETLYEISVLKDIVNSQLLTLVKQSSIDCKIYKNPNCMSFGLVKTDKLSYVPSFEDEDVDTIERLNRKKVTLQVVGVKINKEPYVMNKKTREIYKVTDFNKGADKKWSLVISEDELKPIGIIKTVDGKKKFIKK